jgi:hypothetical protein
MAAAPAANDVIRMCKIPKGATVIWGCVYGQDIDTGTETLDFDAGWEASGDETADPDGFGNFGVVTGDAFGSSEVGAYCLFGGVLRSAGPKTFAADVVAGLTFNAAANAGGTGRLTMVVLYVMP